MIVAVRCAADEREAAAAWARNWDTGGIRTSESPRSPLLMVHLEGHPQRWRQWPAEVRVHSLRLRPTGVADVHVEGPAVVLDALVLELAERGNPSTSFAPSLTERQAKALSLAVDLGYYDIPRPLNLHGLAERLGISPASASELLRRAEREILVGYVRSRAGTALPVHNGLNGHAA